MKQELKESKQILIDHPDVTSVGMGYKYKNGKRTNQVTIVIGVKEKKPVKHIPNDRLIPRSFGRVDTDIQEKVFKALSYTSRKRPCPPGYSIGHHAITAGTLGAWVKRGSSDDYYILSNNHVIANSNDASTGDIILQPGPYDGGEIPYANFAKLTEYVQIKFEGDEKKKKEDGASKLWKLWSYPAHAVARLVGCPYRLRTALPNAVEQPYPNLVDAAIALPNSQDYVDLDYPTGEMGELLGIRDLQLGDKVRKFGRTTEYTKGMVEVVNSMVIVQYGEGKLARFEDQNEIRADSGDFSAGGDSGSAIISEDGYLGSLLFAGGGGVTIANKISHVISLLGLRL